MTRTGRATDRALVVGMSLVAAMAVVVAAFRAAGDRPASCAAAQLTPTMTPLVGSASERVWHLGLTNWFGPTCLLEGYLAVEARDDLHQTLASAAPIQPERRRLVRLRPEMTAHSRISFAYLDTRTDQPCRPAASSLRVTLPNENETFDVDVGPPPLPSDEPILFNPCGRFVIGPIQIGTAVEATGSSTRPSTITASQPTAATTTSTVPAQTPPPPEPTVTAKRRCVAGDLRLTTGRDLDSLMRQTAAYFGLENTSKTACKLQGYPAVEFFDRDGHRINTQVWNGGGYLIQDPGSAPVTLTPKATGWFALNWAVENLRTGNTDGCVDPTAIGVTPPGGSRQLRVAAHLRIGFCPENGLGVTALGLRDSFAHGASGPPTPGN